MLSSLLHVSEVRHSAISHNIANVNTPKYERRDVAFEEAVREILAAESEGVVSGVQPEIRVVKGLPARADGNTVDIDREMTALSKNSLLYQTITQVLASRLGTMRSAVTGR